MIPLFYGRFSHTIAHDYAVFSPWVYQQLTSPALLPTSTFVTTLRWFPFFTWCSLILSLISFSSCPTQVLNLDVGRCLPQSKCPGLWVTLGLVFFNVTGRQCLPFWVTFCHSRFSSINLCTFFHLLSFNVFPKLTFISFTYSLWLATTPTSTHITLLLFVCCLMLISSSPVFQQSHFGPCP